MGYNTGKIYKLVCEDGKYYIGSTIRPLKARLSSHKNASTKTETNIAYNHIKTIGWDNVTIEIIEVFSCENRNQLLERETLHIAQHKEDIMCLNTRNPLTDDTTPEAKQAHKETCRQYYQQHREDILQKRIDYQIQNREKRTQYNKQYSEKNAKSLKEYYKEYADKNRERRNRMARERRKKLCDTQTSSSTGVSSVSITIGTSSTADVSSASDVDGRTTSTDSLTDKKGSIVGTSITGTATATGAETGTGAGATTTGKGALALRREERDRR